MNRIFLSAPVFINALTRFDYSLDSTKYAEYSVLQNRFGLKGLFSFV
jgi:hypothetical protein